MNAYGFLVKGKLEQFDIPHTLLKKLELEKGKGITCPIYLSPSVLDKELIFGAYTIENECEIFLNKPLTINSLPTEITRWLSEIENLKTQVTKLREEKENNQETITNLQVEYNNLVDRITQLESLLVKERSFSLIQLTKLKEWKDQIKFELVPLFWPNATFTEDTPAAKVLIERIKELFSEKDLTEDLTKLKEERDEYQTKWDISLEKLEEKGKIIKDHLRRIKELEREKTNIINIIKNISSLLQVGLVSKNVTNDYSILESQIKEVMEKLKKWVDYFSEKTPEQVQNQINDLNDRIDILTNERDSRPNITLDSWNTIQTQLRDINDQLTNANNNIIQKDNQITSLDFQVASLNTELTKEKDWWDKWFNSMKLNLKGCPHPSKDEYKSLVSVQQEIAQKYNSLVKVEDINSPDYAGASVDYNLHLRIDNKDGSSKLAYGSHYFMEDNSSTKNINSSSSVMFYEKDSPSWLPRPLDYVRGRMLVKAIYLYYRDK